MAGSSKKREPKVRLSRSQIVARQVRMARAALGMTLEKFAKLIGVSANTVSHIEHAHPTLSRTTDGLEEALRSVPAIELLPDNGESIGVRLHYGQLNEDSEPAPRIYGSRHGRGMRRCDPDELKRGMVGSGYPLEKLMKDYSDREKRYGRDKRIGKRSNTETDTKTPDASSSTSPVSATILKAVAEDRIARGENPIRVWREHHNVSLTTLAKKVRIAKGFLSQIETGKRKASLKLQHKIARALGIKPEEFLSAASTENKPGSVPAPPASPKAPIVKPTAPTGLTNELGVPALIPKPKSLSNPASHNAQYLEHLARQEGVSVETFIDRMGQFYREKNAEMYERKPRRR